MISENDVVCVTETHEKVRKVKMGVSGEYERITRQKMGWVSYASAQAK